MHFSNLGGTVTTLTLVVFFTVAGLGCGSAGHPDAADESGRTNIVDVNTANSPTSVTPDEPCTPGTTKTCQLVWFDSRNQKHCITANQHCRKDGSSFLACGARVESDETTPADRALRGGDEGEDAGDAGADSSF